jgi:hypothetical protein
VKLLSAGVLINAIVAEIEAEQGRNGEEKSHEDQKQSILPN